VPTHDRPYGMDEPSRVSLGVGLQDGFGFGDSRPGSPALPSNALINVRLPLAPGLLVWKDLEGKRGREQGKVRGDEMTTTGNEGSVHYETRAT
jgi:hypothetical protein